MGDICVRHLGNPLGLGIIELGPLAVPFTLLGIVGLINAINLLDGLAGGACAIGCVTFAVITFTSGNSTLLVLTIALLGSLIGFLHYNHYPANIFMGDCGSLLLGYCMAVFSVMLATGGTRTVSPYIPLLALGVPILDTLVVMVNRKRSGKRLFSPDNTHIHHRLLVLTCVMVMLRKRVSRLMVSPFDFLILLIVLTVPLLPTEITGQFHLLTVAAKSVVLFVGFKLVLIQQFRHNRNIHLAIAVSALVLVLRSALGF